MKVKALRLGFYGRKRVYEGEVFNLKDPKDFSKRWMEKVSEDSPEPKKESKPAKVLDKDKSVI